MGLLSLLWGIVSLIVMVVAFLPFLGWGNWLVVPFAAAGALFSVISQALTAGDGKGRAKTGLILNLVALVAGVVRLSLGGGLF
ncbi:MAG: hypothetical protein U1A22_09870 [Xanthomonadaceae bacterium]|nr:hypothetical protein [Xanthomonadaceae bacterium]